MYNSMLQKFGGDLYVGIMTVINSVQGGYFHAGKRPDQQCPAGAGGITMEPREYKPGTGRPLYSCPWSASCIQLWYGIRGLVSGVLYPHLQPGGETWWRRNSGYTRIFLWFFMMSLQFAGQSVFVGLGKSRNAVFSIFRKVIIVIPLSSYCPLYSEWEPRAY